MKASRASQKAKRVVAYEVATFMGDTAYNMTTCQFSDFRADAQRLADEIGVGFTIDGIKADGEGFELKVKPFH